MTIYTIISAVIFIATFAIFLYLSFEDIKKQEISSLPLYVALVLNIAHQVYLLFAQNYVDGLLGGLILGGFFLLIVLATKEKGMGLGDVYLFILMGLLVGINYIYWALLITVFGAIIFSFVKYKGFKRKSKISLVPFIFFGCYMTLLIKQVIL